MVVIICALCLSGEVVCMYVDTFLVEESPTRAEFRTLENRFWGCLHMKQRVQWQFIIDGGS